VLHIQQATKEVPLDGNPRREMNAAENEFPAAASRLVIQYSHIGVDLHGN
jgi:hypothetical protein